MASGRESAPLSGLAFPGPPRDAEGIHQDACWRASCSALQRSAGCVPARRGPGSPGMAPHRREFPCWAAGVWWFCMRCARGLVPTQFHSHHPWGSASARCCGRSSQEPLPREPCDTQNFLGGRPQAPSVSPPESFLLWWGTHTLRHSPGLFCQIGWFCYCAMPLSCPGGEVGLEGWLETGKAVDPLQKHHRGGPRKPAMGMKSTNLSLE